MASKSPIYQQDQPPGVPPLEMTGERTLPEVPQENYWYQRHLVVYEWIARRAAGKRVVDMACGEGYGSDVLARSAVSVVGVDANPEAYEHARLKYQRQNLRFARELVEEFREPADVVAFLQTVEHVANPGVALNHFGELVREADGEVVVSTPNVLTLAPPGADKSANPWHVKEFDPQQFHELLRTYYGEMTLYGLFEAGRLRLPRILTGATGSGFPLARSCFDVPGRLRAGFGRSVTTRDFTVRQVERIADLADSLDLIAVCRAR